jgi:methyl-accepting chemotaxis protein
VRLFRQLRFPVKATLISITLLAPVLSLLAWLIHDEYSQALAARQSATRQHVEVAYGMLEWAHAREQAGELNHERAQTLAKESIGRLRYDEKEYFFISDLEPRVVMHPIKPELNGRDASGIKDPNGLPLFQVMADTVRRDGAGFVNYQWPRPGSEKPVDKLSYVKGFAPWGWVLGSGVYLTDIQDQRARKLVWSGAELAVALMVAGYLYLSFFKVMEGGLRETRAHLQALAEGDLTGLPEP